MTASQQIAAKALLEKSRELLIRLSLRLDEPGAEVRECPFCYGPAFGYGPHKPDCQAVIDITRLLGELGWLQNR